MARDSEYLVVQFVDGTTEHLPGPCEHWLDPLVHSEITVRPAVNLDAHQAVVVYQENDGEVSHRVLRGPAVYVPQPNEWLHQFRWHGDNGSGQKVPKALQFTKLRVIPDQMYFDVEGVRIEQDCQGLCRGEKAGGCLDKRLKKDGLSRYVVSVEGRAGHSRKAKGCCGTKGYYFVRGGNGPKPGRIVAELEVPVTGRYLFRFQYRVGSKRQKDESIRVSLGGRSFEFA